MSGVWARNWKDSSYWLDGLEPAPPAAGPLPSADVVIIGAGYTGLNAAIETARGGRSTLVLDAREPGWGCSTRNGGQISTSVKPSLQALSARFGAGRAKAIRQEGRTALEWIETRIKSEGISCDFARCGRYHAAHTPQHYEGLLRDAEILAGEDIAVQPVPRASQRDELGSDVYHGGVIFPRHASLHPAKYLRGLVQSALEAGAIVSGHCPARAIEKTARGFRVQTPKGPIETRDVLIATNGYTSKTTPWLRRRVIPIGSYVIATEPLPQALMNDLFPKRRIASDTCKVVYYYRPSPDGTRVVFGGRVSAGETSPSVSGPKLHADMCRIFPQLSGHKITHSWSGTVAYSFDEMAHTGVHDGMHYALGYCGSGVSMASYLGMRAGQKILGLEQGRTAFDDLPHPARPLYGGHPWFLPAIIGWYRLHDRWQFQRAKIAA